MTTVLLVPPASEPISLAQAKAWLRLDTNDEDDLVQSLIVGARSIVETMTGRALIAQTWRLTRDAWPDTFAINGFFGAADIALDMPLPFAPVASIDAVRVIGDDGAPQLIAAGTYALVDFPDAARIVFMTAPAAPTRSVAGIEIDVVVGYGAAADVPQPLRQAILMMVARWFEDRGDGEAQAPSDLRGAARGLVAPYRRVRLA